MQLNDVTCKKNRATYIESEILLMCNKILSIRITLRLFLAQSKVSTFMAPTSENLIYCDT